MKIHEINSTTHILSVLAAHQSVLKELGVSKLGLFGSYAQGNANFESDMDFYVEFYEGKKNFRNFMDLAFYLEDTFQTKVDLVTDKSLSDRFRNHIEKDLSYVAFDS